MSIDESTGDAAAESRLVVAGAGDGREGSTHADRLRRAIGERTARVGVIGLGYVGLPLVELVRRQGLPGPRVRHRPGQGRAAPGGPELHRPHRLGAGRGAARLGAGSRRRPTSPGWPRPTPILICVPTPLGTHREPDLSAVVADRPGDRPPPPPGPARRPGEHDLSRARPATSSAPELEAGGLVRRPRLLPRLQPRARGPGQPEVLGRRRSPRSSAAGTRASGELAPRPLRRRSCPRSSRSRACEVAEACKILENTYRAVNIALVNELKVVFDRMGIDVWEVIDAAKTKPFGFQAFYPGPGLGGHCIPIDPFYLTWAARRYGLHTRFIELAGEINTAMPHHVVDRVDRGPERPRQGAQGEPRAGPGAGVQARRGRLPREPGVRADGAAPGAGARWSPTTTRTSRSCRRCAGHTIRLESVAAHARSPRRAGLRPDRHRPRRLRLGADRSSTPRSWSTPAGRPVALPDALRASIVMA